MNYPNGGLLGLRKKILSAVERRESESETTRLFDASLSSVKRYARMVSSERSPSLAPKKRHDRAAKVDQQTTKLLNEDVKERLAATKAQRIQFLEHLIGELLSYRPVWRL